MMNPFKRKKELVIPELSKLQLNENDILIIHLPDNHLSASELTLYGNRIRDSLKLISYIDSNRVWIVPGELKFSVLSVGDEATLKELGLQKIPETAHEE